MKKRMISIVCLLSLLLCLIPTSGRASSGYIFIVLNDRVLDLEMRTAPILVGENEISYVPCTIFDLAVTRVDFGLTYGMDGQKKYLWISGNSNNRLEFDLEAGTAYSYWNGETYPYAAVEQNGMLYVPAADVCRYFGLNIKFLDSKHGRIMRIRDRSATVSDEWILELANSSIDEPIRQQPDPPLPPPPRPPIGGEETDTQVPPSVLPDNPFAEADSQRIYAVVFLGIAVQEGKDLSEQMRAIEAQGARGLFFFSPTELSQREDLLRELVGRGHQIGLIPAGESWSEQLSSAVLANEYLGEVLLERAVFVLCPEVTKETYDKWAEVDYIAWSPNVSLESQGRSVGEIYQDALGQVAQQAVRVRMLLDDEVGADSISRILRQLRISQCELGIPRETGY